MFHAVSVAANVDQAWHWPIVTRGSRTGMRGATSAFFDCCGGSCDRYCATRKTRLAIGMLEQNSVQCQDLSERPEIAREVRRELRV